MRAKRHKAEESISKLRSIDGLVRQSMDRIDSIPGPETNQLVFVYGNLRQW